jgi:predicted site-specific integrase-resolvase
MKLSQWAKKQGIAYITAWRWCNENKMPCQWEKTATGTILVYDDAPNNPIEKTLKTYIYGRVSSYSKKEDLNRQIERCETFCSVNGWVVEKIFKDIASGMKDNRKNLNVLFELEPGRLVVEHKDRLTRFGFNYLENLLTKLGWELVVIHRDKEDETDLMKDFVAVITSFCCRLYGLRRGLQKTKEIKECVEPVK